MLRIKSLIIFLPILLSCVISTTALASGSYGSKSHGSKNHSSKSYGSTQKAEVDQVYEKGKAIYTGRSNGALVSYCIMKDGEPVKVDNVSIQQLAGTTYENVGLSLHDCANIAVKMVDVLDDKQLNSVVHYLNKRYKLALEH